MTARPSFAATLAVAALAGCEAGSSVVGAPPEADAAADTTITPVMKDDAGMYVARDAIPVRNADVSCGGTATSLSRRHVTLLLVIDRSGSMAEATTDGVAKWRALRTVFRAVLPRIDADVEIGLTVFPDIGVITQDRAGNTCEVANYLLVEPGPGRVERVLSSLDAIVPDGNTPTWAALDVARRWFHSTPDMDGERYVVLATDGAPNCTPAALQPPECRCPTNPGGGCGPTGSATPIQCLDGDRTTSMIEALEHAGVGTYVVGLNGVQDYAAILDAMAVAGGHPRATSPRFYPANSSTELAEQFSNVTSALVECRFALDAPPPDPTLVDVRLDGASLYYDVRHADGWDWTDDTHLVIRFYGHTCDAVRTASGGSRLVAAFGCPAPVPP